MGWGLGTLRRDSGTKTDAGKAGPGRQREEASKETGLDPALWGVLVPEALCGEWGPTEASTATDCQPHST